MRKRIPVGLKDYEKLKRENYYVVDKTLMIKDFLEQGNGTSHVSIENKDCIGTDLQVVSLDECILEPVTFIKMDIEGAEYEALEGAKHILKKDKPKLAVCLYHKKDDMWRIPYLIKSLVPEYRLYIRHYSNYEGETVLYAI